MLLLCGMCLGVHVSEGYTVQLQVSVGKTNTPPENDAHWKISFQSTNSGAGEQFMLLDCMAKARVKGSFCSQTPVQVTAQDDRA